MRDRKVGEVQNSTAGYYVRIILPSPDTVSEEGNANLRRDLGVVYTEAHRLLTR